MQDGTKKANLRDVYLGLGSNLGNRRQHLLDAIEELSKELGTPKYVSTIIETMPQGFNSPHLFLNMVAMFTTDVSPWELLDITERIENIMGRKTKSCSYRIDLYAGEVVEYFDRPIDIDILLYGNKVVSSPRLKIPHPRMHERFFVLSPLAEISPDLIHPVLGKSISELLRNVSD